MSRDGRALAFRFGKSLRSATQLKSSTKASTKSKRSMLLDRLTLFNDAKQQENCCRATFVDRADVAVANLSELAKGAQDAFVRQSKRALLTTVSLIYGAICEIASANGGAEFLAGRGVKPHGNTENACQPYVRAFTKGVSGWARSAVCKYSQVTAVACEHKIAPEDFEAWLSERTIGDARVEYRRIMAERRKAERDELVGKVLVDPEEEPEKAPILPGTPVTIGHEGLKLAVIRIVDKESGDLRVLGILPHSSEEVMEIVMTTAEKVAAAAGQP